MFTGLALLLLVLVLLVLPPAPARAQGPTITILGPAPEPPISEVQPLFSGTTTDSLDPIFLEIFEGSIVSGLPLQTATELLPLEGNWELAPLVGLADGTYTAQASQTDFALETGTSEPLTFTVDTTAPALSLDQPSSPTSDATPTLEGNAGTATGDEQLVEITVYNGETTLGSEAGKTTTTPTAGHWSTDTPVLSDGTYTAQATQTDQAGNTAHSTPHTFTIDTTAPVLSLDQPSSPSNDANPTIAGSAGNAAGDNTNVTLELYPGMTPTGTPTLELKLARKGNSWSTTTPGPHLSDGTYTAQATQTDQAGNTTSTTPATFTIDTTAPALSLDQPPSPDNDATPTLEGNAGKAAGDEQLVKITVYNGETTLGSEAGKTTTTPTAGHWSTDTPVLPDGTYTAQATQTDQAGNTAHSTPHTFTIDTTAPTTSLNQPSSPTNNANPTINGTAGNTPGDNTNVTLKLYPGTTPTGTPTLELKLARKSNTWSTTTPGPHLSDGTYTAQATQTDQAGNTTSTTPATFTIDTTAPALSLDQLNSPTNDRTPVLGGATGGASGDEQLVKVTIYRGESVSGSEVGTVTASLSSGTWSATSPSLTDGTYTAQAEQGDEAGNTRHTTPITFTVDATSPLVGLSEPGDNTLPNNPNPTIKGTAGNAAGDAANVTLRLYTGTTPTGTPTLELKLARKSNTWSTTTPGPHLADGTYTAQATQTDQAGNTAHSTPHTFTIETNAPTVTLNPVTTPTTDTTPSFSGSAGTRVIDQPDVALKIYAGAAAAGTPVQTLVATVQNNGTWATEPAAKLSDGTYTAQAEQSNSTGGTGVSAPSSFTLDTTPPAVTLTSPGEDTSTSTGSISLGGSAGIEEGDSPNITIELFAGPSIDDQTPLVESIQVVSVGELWSASVGGLGNGTYTLRALQSDSAGNRGVSDDRTFTVDLPEPTAPASHSPPVAAFTVLPRNPKTGEPVSLISTSTDSSSPLATFAWDLSGAGAFQAAGPELTTSFATPGAHVVSLRVTAADGLSALATTEIDVSASHPPLMQPFPIVRIAGSFGSKGARVTLLSVQAPGGARIKVTCRGRHCPVKALTRIASTTSRAGSVKLAFRTFKRTLPPGVVLEIRVSRNGEIGKYTRFVVRRKKLPVRTDMCLDALGVKPIACPTT